MKSLPSRIGFHSTSRDLLQELCGTGKENFQKQALENDEAWTYIVVV